MELAFAWRNIWSGFGPQILRGVKIMRQRRVGQDDAERPMRVGVNAAV
jgi:hypothetical protein